MNARGQSQGPRTHAQVFSEKKGRQNVFQVFLKIFQVIYKFSTIQKIVLSLSCGQGNFRGLEASKLRPRALKYIL